MEKNSEFESYQKAIKKVNDIKGFYSHLFVYIFVMFILTIVNIKYTPEHYWFIYPLTGWGLGVFGHGLGVFGTNRIFGSSWEERKIKKFMEEEKNKKNYQ